MIRLHSRSTLFPYTTLFRSADHNRHNDEDRRANAKIEQERRQPPKWPRQSILERDVLRRDDMDRRVQRRILRSEEHTSELQSRFELVCRLLLEKKKRSRSPL